MSTSNNIKVNMCKDDLIREIQKDTTKEELTADKLQEITKSTVKESTSFFSPGDSEEEQKAWCIRRLTQTLETFDNFVPVIGIFLDNPIVDGMEEDAVHLLFDWGWDTFREKKKPPTPPTPPKETDPFSQSNYEI
jgi:hypothetical protein